MTEQEYTTIEEAFKEAEKDDTPFLVASGGEIAVVGDANKTKLDTHDYEIAFRVPQEQADGSIQYIRTSKKFSGVYITPRDDPKIVKAFTGLLAYFKKVAADDEGHIKISTLSNEEKYELLTNMDDDVVGAMYDVVAAVLGIDEALKNYMLQDSVANATAQILYDFKSAVNEADTFF